MNDVRTIASNSSERDISLSAQSSKMSKICQCGICNKNRPYMSASLSTSEPCVWRLAGQWDGGVAEHASSTGQAALVRV